MKQPNIRLTAKGWYAAQPDRLLLRAPCKGCGTRVRVMRSGVYESAQLHRRRHSCSAAVAA